MLNKIFYSHGKLLLTAEYLILDGAKGLALPTKYGQDLTLEKIIGNQLIWESFDENSIVWFKGQINLPELNSDINNETTKTLLNLLKEAKKLNNDFLNDHVGFRIKTKLTFPRNWGLGTSSTLINNIAKWAQVDAFDLLKNSFGGSGYDVACAQNSSPILYRVKNKNPSIETVNFNPDFKEQLYFVHLNKKQNSKEGIRKYRELKKNSLRMTDEISHLTMLLLNCTQISDFNNLLAEHEKIIASIIQQNPIQDQLFSDYFGQIKSLGAWGGDFVLATGNKDTPRYFKNKGFDTVISYLDMIL